jgi:hypothetical protein
MQKHRVLRTPLVAVLGFLAFLAVPAVAQAHHVETTADCVLENNVPTVQLTAHFVGFSSTHAVTGKVNVDGIQRFSGAVPVEWGYDASKPNDGRWTFKYATTPGQHTVQADFSWPGENVGEDPKTMYTKTCPEPKNPAIQLEKTGAATAAAGSTFTYSFTATNTGNVTLTNVQLSDPKCQSTLVRVPGETGNTLEPGEQAHYTCTVVAPAGPAQVDNVAEVCGEYPPGPTTKVCDDDPHTFTVPPPTTPPTTTPPSSTPNVTPPSGDVLPEEILSGRAALRGPSGCVRQAFRARVSGRSIASVTFFVDGRRVKRVGRGGAFALKVNPKRYGLGRHTIVAVVKFTAESGTKSRRLPLTFRRCAQGAVAPRFTG